MLGICDFLMIQSVLVLHRIKLNVADQLHAKAVAIDQIHPSIDDVVL